MKTYFKYSLYLLYITGLAACRPNERIGIYYEYKITGDEDDSDVTIYLQYRRHAMNGRAVVMNNVRLDGEVLQADSARMSGPYYETRKSREKFAGKHIISFEDENGKEVKEEFVFHPFELKSEIPESMERGDLVFDFDGLDTAARLRVFATDTSFESDDINEAVKARKGRLIIDSFALENIVNGPITIQFFSESERPVKNDFRKGRVLIIYGLRREFVLKE